MSATVRHGAGGMRQRSLSQGAPRAGAGLRALMSGHSTEQSASDRGSVVSSTLKRLE
jgi:hypothetical protein